MAKSDPKQIIEGEVLDVQKQQLELAQLQEALSKNEEFSRFMELTKAVNTKMAEVRKHVEEIMIPAYKDGKIDKNIKGDWGSVTVTESDRFEIDEAELPPKFFKKVVDETKIRATFQLEGKAPKGTKQFKKYGIMLKIK
jgi:hypothetical protein